MSLFWRTLLGPWSWRWDVGLVMLLAVGLYLRGWWRLRRRGRRLAAGWRLAAYLGGWACVALALLSPVDAMGGELFAMHMVQHLLLVMFAPPLLWIANPMPFALWALPAAWRRAMPRWLARGARFRQRLVQATPRGLAWFVFILVYLGWHDPNLYSLALRDPRIHDLEHLTFFGSAMLYWWHVTGMGPRLHTRFPLVARLAYLLGAVPFNMFTGVAIAFAEQPVYPYYTTVPRLYGISVIFDQRLGGFIMWAPGSMMFILAALVFIGRVIGREERKPVLPAEHWDTEAHFRAPWSDDRKEDVA